MHKPLTVIALCTSVLWLGACDKTPSTPPKPTVNLPMATDSRATSSVPSAESVLAPANAAKADPAGGRSNNSMSATQESTAMPMPGQNNDHSAPVVPAKPASAP